MVVIECRPILEAIKKLNIDEQVLGYRIRNKWPQSRWDEFGKAEISTGYTWEEAPKNLKYAAEKLALGLNISAMEAYQLILEKIDFGKS